MENCEQILIKSLNIENNKELDYIFNKIKDIKYHQCMYNFI
jgi:hypothetical protein